MSEGLFEYVYVVCQGEGDSELQKSRTNLRIVGRRGVWDHGEFNIDVKTIWSFTRPESNLSPPPSVTDPPPSKPVHSSFLNLPRRRPGSETESFLTQTSPVSPEAKDSTDK